MDLLKEATIEIIKRMPDGCSLDDIMYELHFVSQVLDGFKDAESGKLLSAEELLKRVDEWAK